MRAYPDYDVLLSPCREAAEGGGVEGDQMGHCFEIRAAGIGRLLLRMSLGGETTEQGNKEEEANNNNNE